MRAFIEATMVDKRFREMWWYMRERHIDRFVSALGGVHGIHEIDGRPVRLVVEALASMTEQSAYTWFAQESVNAVPMTVETASEVVTETWYGAIFRPEARASRPAKAI